MKLYSCSSQPADVHEGIPLLSKIPKFEHHSIASGGVSLSEVTHSSSCNRYALLPKVITVVGS